MTPEELALAIKALPKNPIEWDTAILAQKLVPILQAMVGTTPAKVEVTNITEIDGSILNSLECGDVVIKVTGNQKHSYRVSYKGKGVGEGICLTYVDAGTVETVAYDYTESGWAYNSTDHTTLTPD